MVLVLRVVVEGNLRSENDAFIDLEFWPGSMKMATHGNGNGRSMHGMGIDVANGRMPGNGVYEIMTRKKYRI